MIEHGLHVVQVVRIERDEIATQQTIAWRFPQLELLALSDSWLNLLFAEEFLDRPARQLDTDHRVPLRPQPLHIDTLATQRHEYRADRRKIERRPVRFQVRIDMRLVEADLLRVPAVDPESGIHDGNQYRPIADGSRWAQQFCDTISHQVHREMTMPQQTLHELLEALHAKLNERQQITAQDRELTREVMSDMSRVLRSDSTPPTSTHARGLAAQVVRLEAAHPDLVPIIRQIVETLGQAGV